MTPVCAHCTCWPNSHDWPVTWVKHEGHLYCPTCYRKLDTPVPHVTIPAKDHKP